MFVFPNNYPDHGNYGSCSQPLAHTENCTIACDSNGMFDWVPVGQPYQCISGEWHGGPMSCQYVNAIPGKQGCEVSSWTSGSTDASDCTFSCGGGTRAFTRNVLDYGEPGGEPCPQLSINAPCGSFRCYDLIQSEGYYHWGPFCAGATQRRIEYYINTDRDMDLYIFDAPDFARYTWDSALSTPQNAYYSPVNAYLKTNFEHDTFTVPPNKCYHLVVDNTNVGPTKGQGDQGQFVETNVFFYLKGMSSADGFSNYYTQQGFYQPATAVQSASVSFFGVFLTAIVVLVLKLE